MTLNLKNLLLKEFKNKSLSIDNIYNGIVNNPIFISTEKQEIGKILFDILFNYDNNEVFYKLIIINNNILLKRQLETTDLWNIINEKDKNIVKKSLLNCIKSKEDIQTRKSIGGVISSIAKYELKNSNDINNWKELFEMLEDV